MLRALIVARRRLGVLRVGVSLALYLLACGAFVLLRSQSLFLAVLSIFAVGLLAIRLHRVARRELDEGVATPIERWRIIGLVVAVGAALLGFWFFGNRPDGAGFFGVALLYVALGIGLQELRSWPRPPVNTFVGVLGASVGTALVATIAVAIGLEVAWLVVLVAGLLGVPFGLTLVSELALRRVSLGSPAGGFRLLLVGVAVLAVSLGLLAVDGVSATYLAMLGGGAVVLMAGLVARSSLDVVFVIAAAAVVWTLSQRSVPEPESVRPDPDDRVVVALGDSFISGEGAEVYFDGTNDPGSSTCRRAPTAHPVLLVGEPGLDVADHLAFLACSGAETTGIFEGDDSQLAQLVEGIGPVDDDIAFVMVSAGGNDALFGIIAQTCLLPIDCTELEAAWIGHLDEVGRRLDTLHAALTDALGDVPVLVVPYPVPIAPQSCGFSAFSDDEHRFLNEFTRRLNATVAGAADRAGFAVIDTMPDAFAPTEETPGLRLCDGAAGDAGVNFLAANSVLGTLEQSINPANWIHNSLHPNPVGHEAMRDALVAWLEDNADLSAGAAGTVDLDVAQVPAVATDGPCVGSGDLESCTADWRLRETARLALTDGLLLVPVLAGAWLLALGAVRLWLAVFSDEESS